LEAFMEQAIQLQRELLGYDAPASVILTTNDRKSMAVVESLSLGAIALFPRPWSPELMVGQLRQAVLQNQEQRAMARKYVAFKQSLSGLTDRQRKVLELAAAGMPNTTIANELDVSQRTIESERSKLIQSLGAVSYSHAMISLGEFRVMERFESIRNQIVRQRLRIFGKATSHEPLDVLSPSNFFSTNG
jgi:FixJ family two-component response regulator